MRGRVTMEFFEQSDILIGGEKGYACYRIPAVITSTNGTILAFCEGRKDSASDSGQIDILVMRSDDNGRSFSDYSVVATQRRSTCGNPSPVIDKSTGTILLLFTKNRAKDDERAICEGKGKRSVWITRSSDDGQTWSDPQEITDQVKESDWSWYATGPVHGVQLQNDRIIIPCNHVVKKFGDADNDPHHSHIIYSDDRGKTWKIGGSADSGTNESTILEAFDGKIYLNSRNHPRSPKTGNFRAVSWSTDYGMSFSPTVHDAYLPEHGCQGSVIRLTSVNTEGTNRVLFCNPAPSAPLPNTPPSTSIERKNLTVRLSYDECRSWPISRTVNSSFSGYSDLCIAGDGAICCFYERGEESPYEKLTLARFNLDWLTGSRDSLQTDLEEI